MVVMATRGHMGHTPAVKVNAGFVLCKPNFEAALFQLHLTLNLSGYFQRNL